MVRVTDAVVDQRTRTVVTGGAHCATLGCTSSAVGEAFSRRPIHSVMIRTASSTGMPLIWVPSRKRKLTAPASTSRSPARSMNGTFCVVWLRIFFCIRSSLKSTSARTPAALRLLRDVEQVIGEGLGHRGFRRPAPAPATPGTRPRSARSGHRRTARSSRTARGGS